MAAVVFPRRSAPHPFRVFDGLGWATMGYVTIVGLPDLTLEFETGLDAIIDRVHPIDAPRPRPSAPQMSVAA